MLGSLDIGSVFGIRARLHWTFVVLVVVLFATGWPLGVDPWFNALAVVTLFTLVFLHELGHGLVARRFGLQVLDVTLLPFGGMTRMSRIPEDSRIEAWVAFAGPAVNLALAALALPFLADGALLAALRGEFVGENRFELLAAFFFAANFWWLAIFNLLPAFPLDGGRVARALFALKLDWLAATRRTAAIGKWIAIALIAYGLYAWVAGRPSSVLVPLLGMFLWFSGVRETWIVRMRHAGAELARSMGVPVDAPEPAIAPSSPAPVSAEPDDASGARRPTVLPTFEAPRGKRLSDEDVAELERFRGRIGRAPSAD